jgi:hypothetical protein
MDLVVATFAPARVTRVALPAVESCHDGAGRRATSARFPFVTRATAPGTALARIATMATSKSRSSSRTSKRSTPSKGSTKTSRRYGPKASEKVERAMHEMKRGKLTSGRSGKKVRNPKQAIAIGLSEARRDGAKVPSARSRSRGKSKSSRSAMK